MSKSDLFWIISSIFWARVAPEWFCVLSAFVWAIASLATIGDDA